MAPNPGSLLMTTQHQEALAHLMYGLQGAGGFVLLTGEIGAGKTTLCRLFMEKAPKSARVAYVLNPRLNAVEMLEAVAQELGVRLPKGKAPGRKSWTDAIQRELLRAHAAGQSCSLLLDEAQDIDTHVLEELRLLSNLETHERKLLHITLVGQPELRDRMQEPELTQLSQRLLARYHLGTLPPADVENYIEHRLYSAGWSGPLPFDAHHMPLIHRLSRGVPRKINLLCDRSLLGAYAQGHRTVTRATLLKSAREVFGDQTRPIWHRWLSGLFAI